MEGVRGRGGIGDDDDDSDDSDDAGSVVVVDEVVDLVEDERKVLRRVGGNGVKDQGLVLEKVVRELREPDLAATSDVAGGTVMTGVSTLEERGTADDVVGCGSGREAGVIYDGMSLFEMEIDEDTSGE